MNLLIVGAPGAGKGTMSDLITSNYGIVHISTGDMLRNAIKSSSEVGKKAQSYMDKGEFVPDSIIHEIILERLSQDDINKGFLFDGYPRNLNQALDLTKILDDLNKEIDVVINLEIAENELIKRITGRRLCCKCGEIYNVYYNPTKKEGVCDKCNGELIQRKDDNLESLKVRLTEYHKNTQPMIEYYKKMDLVKDVDAGLKTDDVFKQIEEILRGLK